MDLARTIADLRSRGAAWRKAGGPIGLVPTMGALHAGHLALVETARRDCERVIVSIFVNPKQFGPSEDFTAYPRREAGDLDLLRAAGVALVYLPAVAEMYPPGFATTVTVGGLGEGLCGRDRPGHFAGVATVVAKLLLQALPDAAYFGEKDYQQLLVIRRLAGDLNIPVRIVGVATVRAADGLALSSRNAYLSPRERQIAPTLARTLRAIAGALARAPDRVARELARGHSALAEAGFAVEYLELCDAETLAPRASAAGPPARVFAAARLGRTRLIDNVPVAL
ncbi:MAG: pantoate--beta-alanine ligase [Stellaceae bacterium]